MRFKCNVVQLMKGRNTRKIAVPYLHGGIIGRHFCPTPNEGNEGKTDDLTL